MKRALLFSVPVFVTLFIVAFGAFALFRSPSLRPRIASAKEAVTDAIEEAIE